MPMLLQTSRRELALALFYNCSLETTGNATLSEAKEQACKMLAAEELYDACQALLGVLDGAALPRPTEPRWTPSAVPAPPSKATLAEP